MVKSSAIKILTLKNKSTDNLRFNYELLSNTKFNMLGHARHYISVVQPEEVYTTKKTEQDKIANLFSNLDNLITLHQSKYNNIQAKNKINKREYDITLEQRKLDDFGKSTGGVSIESEFSDKGKYKVISIGSYSETSTYNDQGIRCILSNRTRDKILNKDDLTMILNDKTASDNIIGRVLLIEKSGLYVYNQRTERIEVNKEKYDPLFIYELLNAPNIRNRIIKESQLIQ